ncbi:hypothetical protein VOLCADRAFT_107358 [Volvox carteri f. nagariensis]|uniref:Peptidase M41 domain-containing protein n=1 Tax=Volvox carteri f. nagariensis TaxID=3068 RepID=D8UDH4_VOLCA|nr:uncharacterized protein VOLCADRAFT_107358 [Volvox carteri f. nagariensis]EFJ42312.1 hypothetical protein VOLCADRAFT_107358 [Volvox carteri f. nagariensis]|eukprot:XP_002956710.1 hypothetical protein VOLCADRAFT_107358 [Volvox carteri f. nagariensis]
MAYSQVAVYGMNEKVGLVSFRMDREAFDKPYSDETARLIDEEVRSFVDMAYKRTVALVEKHRTYIEAMTAELLHKEVLSLDDVERLLGKRPFMSQELRNIDRYIIQQLNEKQNSLTLYICGGETEGAGHGDRGAAAQQQRHSSNSDSGCLLAVVLVPCLLLVSMIVVLFPRLFLPFGAQEGGVCGRGGPPFTACTAPTAVVSPVSLCCAVLCYVRERCNECPYEPAAQKLKSQKLVIQRRKFYYATNIHTVNYDRLRRDERVRQMPYTRWGSFVCSLSIIINFISESLLRITFELSRHAE